MRALVTIQCVINRKFWTFGYKKDAPVIIKSSSALLRTLTSSSRSALAWARDDLRKVWKASWTYCSSRRPSSSISLREKVVMEEKGEEGWLEHS